MKNPISVSLTDPVSIRLNVDNPNFVSAELNVSKRKGHKFKKNQKCVLCGLASFPEYNGQTVTITNYREDGQFGKSYYIKGEINKHLNWVYEYRLKAK